MINSEYNASVAELMDNEPMAADLADVDLDAEEEAAREELEREQDGINLMLSAACGRQVKSITGEDGRKHIVGVNYDPATQPAPRKSSEQPAAPASGLLAGDRVRRATGSKAVGVVLAIIPARYWMGKNLPERAEVRWQGRYTSTSTIATSKLRKVEA